MANFIEVKIIGAGKDTVTIYEKYVNNPYTGYINIDSVEYVGVVFDANLTMSTEDGSYVNRKVKYFVIYTPRFKYCLPASEFNKFIKDENTL